MLFVQSQARSIFYDAVVVKWHDIAVRSTKSRIGRGSQVALQKALRFEKKLFMIFSKDDV